MANPLQNWFHSRSSLQPGIRLAAGLLDLGRAAHVSQDEIVIEVNPQTRKTVKVSRHQIEQSRPAPQSPMPGRLINVLSREEILDLLAYLKAGGNPADPVFKAPGQKKP